MNDDVEFVEELVNRFPALEGIYSAHLFNEGELLSHVFFGDVTDEVVSAFLGQDQDALDWRSVLDFLEQRLGRGMPEVDAVICTSFLWNLPYSDKPGHGIVNHLGPVLAEKYHELRPGW